MAAKVWRVGSLACVVADLAAAAGGAPGRPSVGVALASATLAPSASRSFTAPADGTVVRLPKWAY